MIEIISKKIFPNENENEGGEVLIKSKRKIHKINILSRRVLHGNELESKENIRLLLNDLRFVGKNKLIGYLPIDTLENICGTSAENMRKELEAKGLRVLELSESESSVFSGALYVYSERELSSFLLSKNKILKRNRWPIEPEAFVRSLRVIAEDQELFDLIADAFADKNNSNRTKG